MNSKQIDCILAVNTTGNFTRASELVHLTQPSLTYQIRMAEQEAGFAIFLRTSRGAVPTQAGLHLIQALEKSRQMIHHAVEMGKNERVAFRDTIKIGIPMRSVLYFLPEAMVRFQRQHPDINVVAGQIGWEDPATFLQGEFDLYCGMSDNVRNIPDISRTPLFQSQIYLVVNHRDPLAQKATAGIQDLAHRTLMVGGLAPLPLRELHTKVIESVPVNTYNSYDTLTCFIDLKAEKGIGLIPGSMNDHNGEFAWIPFQENVSLPYDLCWHKQDKRPALRAFVRMLKEVYRENDGFAL